ncbi:N-acetylmuramoyl-L-alanine amidase [Neobacillus sp. Marseille-QA0830]
MVKIKLDPGHGGNDPGGVGNGLQEKDLTLTIAKKMGALLGEYEGVEVSYTRSDDRFISLSERAEMANREKADYFLSIHINAGGGTGWESYIHTNANSQSVAYQNVIHPEVLKSIGGVTDRGKKRANYAVLRQTSMPSILTENLFIDNAADAEKLKSDQFLSQLAIGHVEGLAKAFGLRRKKTPSIVYAAHLQNIGWQDEKRDGQTAGTTGQSLRLEALTVRLENSDARLTIEGHVESKGWLPPRSNGEVVGTIGESLRLEAIKISCDKHNVFYRVHLQDTGWTDWKRNGEIAGTTGESKRIEAIEIKLA